MFETVDCWLQIQLGIILILNVHYMSKLLPVANKAALDVFVLQYSFKYHYRNDL